MKKSKKKEEKSGRKGKSGKVSFTLPLLTGMATLLNILTKGPEFQPPLLSLPVDMSEMLFSFSDDNHMG